MPQVVETAMMRCSFGVSPSIYNVIPFWRTMAELPAGTIMDFVPFENVEPYVLCISELNPEVIALTAAALGVPTPAPCIPLTTPFVPGSVNVLIGPFPGLDEESISMCAWAGIVEVLEPGQFQVETP